MDIALTGTQVLAGVIGVIVLIIGLIFILKNIFGSKENLADKYDGQKFSSPLKGRAKYPDVDVFRHSGTLLRLGLAVSLGLTVMAFSWTTYEKVIDVSQYSLCLLYTSPSPRD